MKRRDFLHAIGAAVGSPALIGLTRKSPPPLAGGFVDDGGALGHRLRDRQSFDAPRETRRVPIVIVGGGIAGLSAGWELDRTGMKDFVVLEMEKSGGGNARWGENDITAFPWAAHYVPVPSPQATLVRELFEELGVLRDGVWEERHLCFSPKERLYMHGEWHDGIEPEFALDRAGRDAFARFDEAMERERSTGRFTIPMALGAPRDSPLDRMSMAAWMRREGLTAPALRWYVDYACRDDYGALAEHTSAWAGIHYFASRPHEEEGPLTWPEGTGWIARRLLAKLGARVETGSPVFRVERAATRWRVLTPRVAYLADAVVFSAPTFLASYIVPELAERRPSLVYSPWLTANLTLERWPVERGRRGAPPSWDNVLYDSPALGYVVATHQSLRTRQERSVWTYYWPLAELVPREGRARLTSETWKSWSDRILADLARAHPDIRECVSRIDIMRMGHAMVRPAPGFLSAIEDAHARRLPGLYFANSDLSGLSLFEEAQYRGVTAARRAMRDVGGRR